jgi:hypothetical protein
MGRRARSPKVEKLFSDARRDRLTSALKPRAAKAHGSVRVGVVRASAKADCGTDEFGRNIMQPLMAARYSMAKHPPEALRLMTAIVKRQQDIPVACHTSQRGIASGDRVYGRSPIAR